MESSVKTSCDTFADGIKWASKVVCSLPFTASCAIPLRCDRRERPAPEELQAGLCVISYQNSLLFAYHYIGTFDATTQASSCERWLQKRYPAEFDFAHTITEQGVHIAGQYCQSPNAEEVDGDGIAPVQVTVSQINDSNHWRDERRGKIERVVGVYLRHNFKLVVLGRFYQFHVVSSNDIKAIYYPCLGISQNSPLRW